MIVSFLSLDHERKKLMVPFFQNFFLTEADVDEDDEDEEEDEVEEGWEQHKANRENEKGPSARDIENERRLASDLDGVDEEQIEEYYRWGDW